MNRTPDATVCRRGHALTVWNTVAHGVMGRKCRTCNREDAAKHAALPTSIAFRLSRRLIRAAKRAAWLAARADARRLALVH